ncbi:LAQU0S37e00122g1_1 [Lachancea quebecensis]|uniref:LAQU0S37e00122g1_1 n=1 Tax=Lachancea quebecensis TaxID=1654605 RepID=A0A0P1L428_9SACH|nr:LAQU0S37e00122g1_1 [Lachancea quebecensis]
MDRGTHVVIVGGSFAGVRAAETFLAMHEPIKVTMISVSSHAYFCVAAPRLLIEPGIADKVFFSVEEKLQKLGNGNVSFLLGRVEKVEFNDNAVIYKSDKDEEILLNYDYLVIATGSRSRHPAFKLEGNHEVTKRAVTSLNEEIENASEIIVLGGGATAVEVAGELGEKYGGNKNITIYTGSEGPLKGWLPSLAEAATQQLKNLNIKVVNNARSTSLSKSGNGWEVSFSDGTTEIADLVIPAYGVIPNTECINQEFLDAHGYLVTDENLKVKAYPNVLALGDVVSGRPCTIVDLDQVQVPTFRSAAYSIISEQKQATKPLKTTPNIGLVPISRKGGVGIIFGWALPSFLVRFLKSKDFMVSRGSKTFT